MGADPTVLNMLRQMEFTQSNLPNARFYYNHAASSTNIAELCFTAKYNSSYDAQMAETLIDLHLRVSEKGTHDFPSKDRLIRAYKSQQAVPVQMYTERQLNKLTLVVPLKYESEKDLLVQSTLLHQMLLSPHGFSQRTIFEKVKDEEIKKIEDRITNHELMASTKFKQCFFPSLSPLSEDKEKEIINNSEPWLLDFALQKHINNSTACVLASGPLPEQEVSSTIQKQFGDFLKSKHSYKKCAPLKMKRIGEPIQKIGPSEQMHFIRAYPLQKKLTNIREQLCLEMANEILGGSWNSPLMQIIREQHHLVYGIGSTFFPALQLLSISTSHNPKDLKKIDKLTEIITTNIIRGNIPKIQFEIEKERMLENYIAQSHHNIQTCDSPLMRIDYAHRRYVEKTQRIPIAQEYNLLSTISLREMKQVLRAHIDPEQSQIFTYCNEVLK